MPKAFFRKLKVYMTQIMKLSLSQDMFSLMFQKFGAAFLERTKNVTS